MVARICFLKIALGFVCLISSENGFGRTCSSSSQRPNNINDIRNLFEIGRRLKTNITPTSILTVKGQNAFDGVNNLGVFVVEGDDEVLTAEQSRGAVLKFQTKQGPAQRPYDKNLDRKLPQKLIEYASAHLALGEIKVSPSIIALMDHGDLVDFYRASPELKRLLGFKYQGLTEQDFSSQISLGVIMNQLKLIHPLLRRVHPPLFMMSWCEDHVRRALTQIIEIRKRVIEAGIALKDQQLVVDPDANVYLIDVDPYRFDFRAAEQTDFSNEANNLVSSWELATAKQFDRVTFDDLRQRLHQRYEACSRRVDSPWPEFREVEKVICENIADSTSFAYAGLAQMTKVTINNPDDEPSEEAKQALESLHKLKIFLERHRSDVAEVVMASTTLTVIGLNFRRLLALSRGLTPWGAFSVALGLSSKAAASDYCSPYEDLEELEFLFSLTASEQLQEMTVCPFLPRAILDFVSELESSRFAQAP